MVSAWKCWLLLFLFLFFFIVYNSGLEIGCRGPFLGKLLQTFSVMGATYRYHCDKRRRDSPVLEACWLTQ